MTRMHAVESLVGVGAFAIISDVPYDRRIVRAARTAAGQRTCDRAGSGTARTARQSELARERPPRWRRPPSTAPHRNLGHVPRTSRVADPRPAHVPPDRAAMN